MWSTAYLLNQPQDAVMRNLNGTKFMHKGKCDTGRYCLSRKDVTNDHGKYM